MIVDTPRLSEFRGAVTMVDGGFDPIHDGHVRYFAAAAVLGLPVLCNVSPDRWVESKHVPLLPQDCRVIVIDAFRDIDYVHLSTGTTVEVLDLLRPRYYAKGSDWKGRLPEAEQRACREGGVEVVYLDTLANSSSRLLARYLERQHTPI